MSEQRHGPDDLSLRGDRVRDLGDASGLLPVARRLLRCETVGAVAFPDEAGGDNSLQARLTCGGDGAPEAALVARDAADRQWTADDHEALGEIATCLDAFARQYRDGGSPDAAVFAGLGGDTEATRDIRTSLQAIIGFTELMKRETRPDLVAAHAATIQETTETLLRQIGQSSGDMCAVDSGASESEPVAPTADSAHILLADDLDLNRKLICDMLSLDGHIVDSVADGASAVKAACERSYDLILMDMIMPGMDGVTATRAIRALPAPACEVPIVALTAHSQPEQLDSCLQAGMDATLTKPMSIDALTDAVATWTRRRRKAA